MKLGKIIQRFLSAYSKGVQSDDARLSERHIYNKIITTRGRLLSQQAKKRQKISDWNYVVLPCVEVIDVGEHECPCLPQFNCKVKRTKHKLPKPLLNYDNHIIDWVLSLDNRVKFEEISREAYRNIKGNRFTKDASYYIIENGYLYFYGKITPGALKIKLLPGDPLEAQNFPSFCDTEGCTDCTDCENQMDKDFPIEEDMIEVLIQMSMPELIDMFNKNIEDKSNNTRDNPAEGSK